MTDADEILVSKYTRAVGHPPRNLPEDHPDLWQWEYRGTPQERAELEAQIAKEDEMIEGQQDLFGEAA